MRHSNVATTMNVYGNASLRAKQRANSKVVQMVMPQELPRAASSPWRFELLSGSVGLETKDNDVSCWFFGSSDRTRTYNPSVNRRVLNGGVVMFSTE